jgi:hypothetical protein
MGVEHLGVSDHRCDRRTHRCRQAHPEVGKIASR